MKGEYHQAYLREKQARLEAEKILEHRTRSLYLAKQELVEMNAELMGHNRELIKSEKLAALGRLSAGVAHEIKNPLAYIISNIKFLEEFIENQQKTISNIMESSELGVSEDACDTVLLHSDEEVDEIHDLITDVYKGLGRIDEISSSLTGYSHKKKEEVNLVNINSVINDTLKIMEANEKPDTKINFQQGDLPLMHGVENEYSQIFLNLISNSFHAVIKKSAGVVNIVTNTASGGVSVVISDNGEGMDKATIDRAFDPFFTTKGVGEGTGLGLYLAYTIVQKLNGTIKVKSKLGEGCCFSLFFPTTNQ
jgi:signal transduction histidine kinase